MAMVNSMFLWEDIKTRLYVTVHNASLILRSVESHLYWEDYQKILTDKVQEDDFIYLDPMTSAANFTGYTGPGFAKRDQKYLAKTFKKLDGRGCKVLLSNFDIDYIRGVVY